MVPAEAMTTDDDSPPKAEISEAVDFPSGMGQHEETANLVVRALESWSDEHPEENISEIWVEENDRLIAVVRSVGRELAPDAKSSLEKIISDIQMGIGVSYQVVDVSAAQLGDLRARIRADQEELHTAVGAVSVNFSDDRTEIVVAIDGDSDVEKAQQYLRERYGENVTAAVDGFRLDSRRYDTSPYWAGIPLYTSAGGAINCSSGPWVNKPGFSNFMLTASHCVGNANGVNQYHYALTIPNTLVKVGHSSAYSTAVDAALITGSYQSRIWLGSTTSTTSHAVDRRVVSESTSTVVCAGGARTGQVCRNQIADLDYETPAGVHTVKACNYDNQDPSEPGDSGASVYHVDSAGLLYVHGIINGDFVNSKCFVYVPMYRLENALGISLILY